MKTALLLLGCLLALASSAQEVKRELWTWKDANGVVHFSDVPVQGAHKVDLNVSQPSAPAAAAPASTTSTGSTAKPPTAPGATYESLEIWQPTSGESFFGADATVSVRIRTEPAVSPDDSLLLYLDGKLVQGPANSLDYTLANLDRGAHSVAASIIGVDGKEKIRSQPVVFHIKHATIIPPAAVGPNLKPTPKPTPKAGG
jgi:hypothetical protein